MVAMTPVLNPNDRVTAHDRTDTVIRLTRKHSQDGADVWFDGRLYTEFYPLDVLVKEERLWLNTGCT
jgi:hypothetical protein